MIPIDSDELLDLVDENDQVTGQKKRSDIYREGMSNFRVVNLFLINSKGELWIPRRSAHKRIFPLCLDMSMGGHVASGESYEEALQRELQEELNIDLEAAGYRLLGQLTPHEHKVSAFMRVYEVQSDRVPAFNRNDFIEYFWLTPRQALSRIRQGEPCKDDLPRLIRHFYLAR
jgi:isopentenyldiphosphate isomerase